MHSGVTVRVIRELTGFSQQALASSTGVDRHKLGRIERGETAPDMAFLRAFCQLYGCGMQIFTRPPADLVKILDDALEAIQPERKA